MTNVAGVLPPSPFQFCSQAVVQTWNNMVWIYNNTFVDTAVGYADVCNFWWWSGVSVLPLHIRLQHLGCILAQTKLDQFF